MFIKFAKKLKYMEQDKTNIEFDISLLPETDDISDIIFSLMVNPNLSPLNYFNDFTEGNIDLNNLKEDEINESGFFELEDGSVIMSMTTHAMHHHLENDPQKAAEILVSRAARRMVCYGAKPVAITALLYHIDYADPNGNFIALGIKDGLQNAANAYHLKISDRKIRFDHFGTHGGQTPTLFVSLMGILSKNGDSNLKPMAPGFKLKGNNIFMIGRTSDDIASSDYLEYYHGITDSPLPEFDLGFEFKLIEIVKKLIDNKLVMTVSPVAKGGLFFTLLRAGWPYGLGFDITTVAETRIDSFLFGESMGRVIVGVDPEMEDAFVDFMYESKMPFFTLGHVTKGEIRIDDQSFGYIDKMTDNL
jgi:phosphoribosylformylglycinamidine synthase subunit PurL